MLKALQKLLTLGLLTIAAGYLLYQGFMYTRTREQMPPGMTIASLDVSGLTAEEAAGRLQERYLSPIALYHRDERVELLPADVGFQLDLDAMLQEAEANRTPEEPWLEFVEFVVGHSFNPVTVELYATHDREALLDRLETLATFLDKPATGPVLAEENRAFQMGQPGYVTDIEASLPDVETALYLPEGREAELVVVDQEAQPFDLEMLGASLGAELQSFDGMGSLFVMNLDTGEELGVNEDVALSGLSVVKIAILLETYRAIDNEPTPDQAKLITETAVNSGNYSANLLLDVVAGQDNAYLGVDILTESMQRLGLENTFIVTPYEEPNRPGKTTMSTPANSRVDINTFPDPTMQTTAEDMGTLLSMIYYCAQGGGTLLALYPDQLTPQECQAIIDIMSKNEEAELIRHGVPDGTTVAHKHGWAGNTHGDAGIVLSPGADYVIVEYLLQPDSDWLVHDISFPILQELSRTVYNYFNYEAPYFGDKDVRAGQEPEVAPEPEPVEPEAITPEAGEPEAPVEPEAPPATPTPEDENRLPEGVEAWYRQLDAHLLSQHLL